MADTLYPDWLQSIIVFILLGVVIYMLMRQARELREMQERLQRKVKRYTIIDCNGKDYTREYKEGDYVGAQADCPENQKGYIKAIYAEEPEDKNKKKKKQ
ncbi:MAG: hypothetical protein GSR77_07610 [Desulfurococcales archaeon]|nr:hypothetical protein [Desulfurococcales archaeon]